MLDIYFRRPVFWDYFISTILIICVVVLNMKGFLIIPKESIYISIISDISSIGLTSAGFILTLLTVLITFKSGSKLTKEEYENAKSVFELFFISDLYFETVKHLKNCIKSLIIISIFGYVLKLGLSPEYRYLIYFSNYLGLTIIILTLWRCLLILSKILSMQKQQISDT